MRVFLVTYGDVLTNILDLLAFLLVTPDLVGKRRLERLQAWLKSRDSLAVLKRGNEPPLTVWTAIKRWLIALTILASGTFNDRIIRWANTLPGIGLLIVLLPLAAWSVYCLVTLYRNFDTILTVPVALAGKLLEAILHRWELGGVMLAAGAIIFTLSRGLGIWHSLQSGG